MAFRKINVDDIVSGSGIELDKGKFNARVFGVMDLGIQQQSFEGKKGKAVQRFRIWVELDKHTTEDSDGNKIPLAVKIDFNLSRGENATLTKLIDAFDLDENNFCVTEMLGKSIRLKIGVPEKSKTGRNAVIGFSPSKGKVDELHRDEFLFTIDDPDMKVYNRLFEWEQEELKKAKNYSQSKLKKILGDDDEDGDDGYEEEVDDDEEEEENPKKKKASKKKKPVKEIVVEPEDEEDDEDEEEF